MIAVVDYGAGNLASVVNALARLDVEPVIAADPAALARGRGVILPGVGHAGAAMEALRRTGMADAIIDANVPILGICLGMQLLFSESDEGGVEALGILPGRVSLLDRARMKVPHMGWNAISHKAASPIFAGVDAGTCFYFAHSYAVLPPSAAAIAEVEEAGVEMLAAVQAKKFFGVQFHPEKSGAAGLRVLQNFVALCGASE